MRQSPRVKRLLQREFTRRDWADAGQGWEGREDRIQLAGWQQSRRVIILRRLLKQNLIATQEQQGQLEFAFVDRRQTKVYEYAVLVTDLKESILGIAQLYRDRADAENGFDELKNQWGVRPESRLYFCFTGGGYPDKTGCSINRSLPRHAELVTTRCEALGTM